MWVTVLLCPVELKMGLKSLAFVCVFRLIFVVSEGQSTLNDVLFSGNYEFIDLTHPYDNSTIYWPGTQKFVFTKKLAGYRRDGTWYAANDFASGEHGGTHIDAPSHFTKSGVSVGGLPVDKLIASLIIVDVSSMVNDDENFVLYKYHLDYMLNYNFGKPTLIIFKFGWSKYFNDRNKYLGVEENTDTLKFPGLSNEIAEWLTASYKNVVGIGVDVASVDPGSSEEFRVHKTLSQNGIYNIENVNLNLNRTIPEFGCTALVMPMLISEGTGAPVRLIAICPKVVPPLYNV